MSFVAAQYELFMVVELFLVGSLVNVQYGLLLVALLITGQYELFLIVLFVAV